MNSKQIDYILEIAETGNFNQAAENLYVSQPTMTYQIKQVESEIGFQLFERNGKGAALTPAGEQFIVTLKDIRQQLNKAIEMGQNFSASYSENIRICMPTRSCLILLPEVMEQFADEDPSVNITPFFDWHHGLDSFLRGDQDILFTNYDLVRHIPDIQIHDIYEGRYYFVCNKKDPYAKRKIIHEEDLKGRTLMVNGGSGATLKKIQQRIIAHTNCNYFNSDDHDTSLTNIAANKAIVIAPGSLNDHTDAFVWIPFDCEERLHYVLITHANDQRWSLHRFVDLLKEKYQKTKIPL